MKNKILNKQLIIICSILIVIISFFTVIIIKINSLKIYQNIIFPNTYIENINISNIRFKDKEKLLKVSKKINNKIIKLNINNTNYKYTYKELGINIDYEKTIEKIKKYQNNLTLFQKLYRISIKNKNEFSFTYTINEEVLRNSLNNIKTLVDKEVINGYFDTKEAVVYHRGMDGYNLNIEDSYLEIIKEVIHSGESFKKIYLKGEVLEAINNEDYTKIDTLTSKSVTKFIPNTYLRNINLNTALAYINGTVVEPGEVFSYCDKAGPFNKKGYVFYYEFVGNGVCQIATTTYNAALNGGLEIVKRYPHGKKSLYIEGGLDATVASYANGWCVDMQFKNTYQYPIYIKAYSEGGMAHVEFWSNSNAKEGKEYTVESVRIGLRGYKSYRHTWVNGVIVDTKEIATTWYTEE